MFSGGGLVKTVCIAAGIVTGLFILLRLKLVIRDLICCYVL